MIKILHTADFHFSRERQTPALKSLNCFCDMGEKQKIDLFVIAGDLFDRAVQNTESSGLPELQSVIQRMMMIAPVVVVKGTITHDIPGCYEIFEKIKALHNFTILKPGQEYFLSVDNIVTINRRDQNRLLILGCPEPTKNWLLANREAMSPAIANQTMQEEMRKLLLGYGAIRKEYPAMPCLFVYHGEISGAKMCNGQTLQNSMAIGRDDLALVGADYYALGHIHLAQQIPNLPAWYSGSGDPVDWGETDQKGYNLVKLDLSYEFGPVVTLRGYPHPPRKKIEIDFSGFGNVQMLDGYELSGFQIWLEVKISAIDAPDYDIAAMEKSISDAGALPGSRVTLDIIATETVRAAGISKAKSLREKVKIYAENSSEEISESILKKADQLEAEAEKAGLRPKGLHIRSRKLKLRGAIGVWKGQRRDEIELDLDNYDPGLLVVIGKNGMGKTTVFENMHPYPSMPTHPGKLQDQFRLRDSYRDYYFCDERTGTEYRSLISIDGKNESGSIECYLFQKKGDKFEPLTNGRRADYDEKLLSLFGSYTLFLRSAFVAQKPPKGVPELESSTQGEKKSMLVELGGLQYLQDYSKLAGEKEKSLEAEIQSLRNRIDSLQIITASLPAKLDEEKNFEEDLVVNKKQLADQEQIGKGLSEKLAKLKADLDANNQRIAEIAEAEKKIRLITQENFEHSAKIGEYNTSLETLPKAKADLKKYDDLKAKEAKLNAEKLRILEANSNLDKTYNDSLRIAEDKKRGLLAAKMEHMRHSAEMDTKKAVLVQKIDTLDEKLALPLDKNCPTCGQVLPAETLAELKRARQVIDEQMKEGQDRAFNLDQDINEQARKIEQIDVAIQDIKYPLMPDQPGFDNESLQNIMQQIRSIDIDKINRTISDAGKASTRIEELQKQIEKNEKEIDNLIELKNGLEIYLDPESKDRFSEAEAELETARKQYIEINKSVAGLQAQLISIQEQIATLESKTLELQDCKKRVAITELEIREWNWLRKACGPNGIQALELDNMAPGISRIANRMLAKAYGSRFQIKFETTRISGTGSKAKQIEDFQIWVEDAEDNSRQLLDTLSGGESVWIKRALYDAFGIVRDQDTGTKFLTVFQDETDGALDLENRLQYFRMLEAAHIESGRHHTLLISHSIEAQQMIAQQIDVTKLPDITEEETA